MERVYGVSLESFLERRIRAGTPLTLDETLRFAIALAEGLAATHRAGIAHRDVKPSNVMLAPGDRLVLMDFGLFLAENDPALTGATSGSPAYMAPETILGESAPGSGFLVDVYAFGVLVFEMLANVLPFAADSVTSVFGQHLAAPVPDLSTIRDDAPSSLTDLVRSMLAKNAADRPASMDFVAQRLSAIQRARTAGAAPSERFAVMIVDDDPAMAALLRALVLATVPDADIRVVTDGERAIDLAQQWAPHLMLLDLMMPKMSGVEVCMYLRGAHVADRCSIVSVSAGAEEHDVQLLHQLGITRFLRKGPKLATLLPPIVADVHRLARAASIER
jgi:serine/threonine-protein kinase